MLVVGVNCEFAPARLLMNSTHRERAARSSSIKVFTRLTWRHPGFLLLVVTALLGAQAPSTWADSVVAWGYNAFGEIGDGTTTNRTAPMAVSGLSSGVTAVAGGESTALPSKMAACTPGVITTMANWATARRRTAILPCLLAD